MKSFLKYTLATITGIILSGLLFMVIMIFTLAAMMGSADKPATIGKNSVLVLNTGQVIPERGSSDPFSSFDPVDFSFKPSPGVNDIINNLEKAARDERIKGVLIENGPMVNGLAKAEEIRLALLKFRESGKFVISYTDYYMTQEAYFISTAADKIVMSPVSILEFKGLSSDIMFYKKALEKLGIEVQVVKHGKYKGAVEPFTGNELSPENRSQIERFTAGIWGNMLSEISESRGIPVTDLNRIADELTTTSIDRAMELGMIDSLVYRDQLNDMLESLSGAEPELVSMYKYKTVPVDSNSEKNGKIALLYAEGNIVMGKGNESNIGGDFYASVIRKIRESGTYDAMVIRLNSPGGNAMASDLIWREISLAAEEMPVVVSMSDYAASGGYYISAPATKILAHANTITGSIGVFGMIPQAGKLLENRLGITTESVKTNRFSDSPSLFRAMEPAERITMQVSVDKTYDDFIGKVALGRNIPKEEVDQMGEGQVYAGTDALEKGLIDAIGGMADAMEEASTLAGITGYRVVEFPTYEDPYSRILKSLSGEIKTSLLLKELGEDALFYNDIREIRSMRGVQARLPYFLSIR